MWPLRPQWCSWRHPGFPESGDPSDSQKRQSSPWSRPPSKPHPPGGPTIQSDFFSVSFSCCCSFKKSQCLQSGFSNLSIWTRKHTVPYLSVEGNWAPAACAKPAPPPPSFSPGSPSLLTGCQSPDALPAPALAYRITVTKQKSGQKQYAYLIQFHFIYMILLLVIEMVAINKIIKHTQSHTQWTYGSLKIITDRLGFRSKVMVMVCVCACTGDQNLESLLWQLLFQL